MSEPMISAPYHLSDGCDDCDLESDEPRRCGECGEFYNRLNRCKCWWIDMQINEALGA